MKHHMRRVRRTTTFFLIISFLVLWALVLGIVGPTAIVELLGIHQGYLVVFLVAAFGGISSLTATSYFATIITLAAGGLDPVLLGILGGAGVTIGDSLFFFAGRHGRNVLPDEWYASLERFGKWLRKQPSWIIPAVVYVYAAFTPFPNEFVTVSVGLCGTRYRRIVLPLLLGNITITILIASFVAQIA
ncbi:hypothetical protein GOV07_03875 [Candidatus Woesearchaeota archaeon]|nr:hypothetical protein [Candidatus Woesearchaeota archaeon]